MIDGENKMINQLKAELDRINQGCGKNLGAYMEIPKEFQNATDKIRNERAYSVDVICGKQVLCPICQKEKQTLKKVSLMWVDEMLDIFDYDEPIREELQEIKSLMEQK